jgi:DNA-binding transcriptional LysR family regulator
MSENLAAMAIFVRVVEAGGFSRAADRLGISKSAVSKQVAKLEDRLGTRLLNRTTRQFSLTEVGTRLFERGQRIIAEAEAAEAEAGSLQVHPSGTVRISAGVSFGQDNIAPLLPKLMQRYPELTVDLILNDRFVDLVEEGYDLAIRIGTLEDSALRARRLSPVRMVTAAAPSYLEAAGTPKHPRELSDHACLSYAYVESGLAWRFNGADGPVRVRFQPRLQCNNGHALAMAAIQGLGVVHLPTFIAAKPIRDGDLVPILWEYEPTPLGLFVVYPPGRPVAAKVRAVIDFLAEECTGQPFWDEGLPARIEA